MFNCPGSYLFRGPSGKVLVRQYLRKTKDAGPSQMLFYVFYSLLTFLSISTMYVREVPLTLKGSEISFISRPLTCTTSRRSVLNDKKYGRANSLVLRIKYYADNLYN